MGLSGCYGVIKYLVVFVNFIFLLVGLTVVSVAIWMLTDSTFYVSMAQEENDYYIGLYIFLASGILMLIVTFLGCCGAFKESQCMLISFFSCLLVILVAEIAAGAWVYFNADKLEAIVRKSVKVTVQEEYSVKNSRTITFDAIQKELQCCGANGMSDWINSKFSKEEEAKISLKTGIREPAMFSVPQSCCVEGTDPNTCNAATKAVIASKLNPVLYSQGCINKLIAALKNNANVLFGVTIALIIVEVLGLIFALVLSFAVNRSDRYKA